MMPTKIVRSLFLTGNEHANPLLFFHETAIFISLLSTSITDEKQIIFSMKITYLCTCVALLILRYLFCNYFVNRLFTVETGYL
jgi:hypothetical protein